MGDGHLSVMLLLATCLLVTPAKMANVPEWQIECRRDVAQRFPMHRVDVVDVAEKFPMPVFPGAPTVPMPGADGAAIRPNSRTPRARPAR